MAVWMHGEGDALFSIDDMTAVICHKYPLYITKVLVHPAMQQMKSWLLEGRGNPPQGLKDRQMTWAYGCGPSEVQERRSALTEWRERARARSGFTATRPAYSFELLGP